MYTHIIALWFLILPNFAVLASFHNVHIGELIVIPLPSDEQLEQMPAWLSSNGTHLYGIPNAGDIPNGRLLLTFESSEIVIQEAQEENICGYKDTLLFEVLMPHFYADYTVDKRAEIIRDFATTMDLPISSFRAFPYNYIEKWRLRRNDVYSYHNSLLATHVGDHMVIVWVLNCGMIEDDEDNFSIIMVVNDNNYTFSVTQSVINIETEATTDASLRTTRQINLHPKRINSLPSYNCVRGKICNLRIPDNTFSDAEQRLENLSYSVYAIEHEQTFLQASYPWMKGIALDDGVFEFRLEARDNADQPAAAPFRVVVHDELPLGYSYNLLLDRKTSEISGVKRAALVEKLANVLSIDMDKIRLVSIESKNKNRQSLVQWTYQPFFRNNRCNMDEINALLGHMVYKRKTVPQQAFVKQIGKEFLIREVSLNAEKCIHNNSVITDQIFDTQPTVNTKSIGEHDSTPTILILLTTVVCIVVIAALVLAAVYCCLFRKSGNKMQKRTHEYVTKGQPVVFPNELTSGDELQRVSAPMLVKDERPPLQPMLEGGVVHENPLYKAPAATKPLINATASSNSHGFHNQRMPPPYISP